VIDRIIQQVMDKVYTYVAGHSVSRNIGLEIRNSRDQADEYGRNPYVSRVAVGLRKGAWPSFGADGIAQYIDVGNFNTHDEAVVTVDFMAPALASFPIQAPLTALDALAVAIGDLTSHEFGHILGCYHTDQPSFFEGAPNLMDPNGTTVLGPDFIFGSKDDVVREFGVDAYNRNEPFEGINDTLNTVAFGLSTGKGATRAGLGTSPPQQMKPRTSPRATGLVDDLISTTTSIVG
jgi:hypothetical protein